MNERGAKVAVVIGIEEYEKLLEELEDLEDIRAYDEAMASGETPVPFEEAIERRARKKPHADKQLSQFSSPIYDSIKARIFELRDAPRPPGCRKLRGRKGWRIRVADNRVIYIINDVEKTVAVIQIGHRSDVYR